MLCDLCLAILQARKWKIPDPRDPRQGSAHFHHKEPSSLERSAAQRCYVCRRLWDAMSADDQRMLKHAEQVDSRTYDDSKSPSAKVGLDYDKYLCLAFVGSQQFDRASAPSTKFGVFAVVLNEDYQLRRFGEERLQLVSVHLLEPLSSAISRMSFSCQ